ncbi:lytic transglycosylase domain-containing protein [Nitratidesulfovibrio sp.]|uniref:lytic transglycosylase domain-containing protein n=1 Tax=Nitratidesulfovibrio sp. TaxID=2802297 RepID=UPI003340B2F8
MPVPAPGPHGVPYTKEPTSATPLRWRGRGRVALLAAALTLAMAAPFGACGWHVRPAAAAPAGEIVTIYRYVDEDGVVHLTDKPKGDTRYRVFGRFKVQELVKAVGPVGIKGLAARHGARHGVDPKLVEAVIAVESNYDPTAVSPAGAQGLMQIMPGTQRDLGVSAPFDADANVEGGVRYLKSLMDRFGELPLALAAYNAGPERVAKHGGIPPIPETQQYVTKVMDTYARLSQ